MALPTEIGYIEQSEIQLSKKFPQWLTERLLSENGGDIFIEDEDWQLFSVLDSRDKKHLTRSATQIITETKTAKTWDNFPQNAIAVASNGSGDLLVLLPKNEQEFGETIYLWSHEDGEIEEVSLD